MDPIGMALILGGGAAAGKKFVEGLVGPSAGGTWVRDQIAALFGKNTDAVVCRASTMLAGAALPTQEVPPKRLIPLLQGAALEDDSELQERWAALLANAGAGLLPDDLHAVFASILGRLRSVDAVVLDEIVKAGTAPHERGGMLRGTLGDRLPTLSGSDLSLALSVLAREGLVENQPAKIYAGSLSEPSAEDAIRPTILAVHFARACQAPEAHRVNPPAPEIE